MLKKMSSKELHEDSVGLLTNEEQSDSITDHLRLNHRQVLPQHDHWHRSGTFLSWCQHCSWALNVVLMIITSILYVQNTRLSSPLPPWPTRIYCKPNLNMRHIKAGWHLTPYAAPAEGAIEYETVYFDTNLRADV
jgi:hypothetical protein